MLLSASSRRSLPLHTWKVTEEVRTTPVAWVALLVFFIHVLFVYVD